MRHTVRVPDWAPPTVPLLGSLLGQLCGPMKTHHCFGCATRGSGQVGIREYSSWGGFTLRCFQQLSAPHLATQHLPWAR
ncbi:hypothetical protein E2542_SST21613 [Spatholobus suberectus]|nr:hypothetical protein E2542_SST21613 [Spatholobus suberectus]